MSERSRVPSVRPGWNRVVLNVVSRAPGPAQRPDTRIPRSHGVTGFSAPTGFYCAPNVGAGRGVGIDWIPCATAEQLASTTPSMMTMSTHPTMQEAACIPKKPKNPAFAAEPTVMPRLVGNHWAPFHHLPSGDRCGPGGGGCTAASIGTGPADGPMQPTTRRQTHSSRVVGSLRGPDSGKALHQRRRLLSWRRPPTRSCSALVATGR